MREVVAAGGLLLMTVTVEGQVSFSRVSTNPELGRLDFIAAVADINGDGRDDILAGGREEYRSDGVPDDRLTKASLHILVGKEDGGFSHAPELVEGTIEARDARVVTDDFNGDGQADLAVFDAGVGVAEESVGYGNPPQLWLSSHDGVLRPSEGLADAVRAEHALRPPTGKGLSAPADLHLKSAAAGDIDNDGDLDLWVESTGGKNVASHFMVNNGVSMLSRAPDRGKSSSAAGGESVHSGTGADLYVRWSNVAANPNVTSGERTYRQGRDRPCAGLRWPRTANPASGQSLHLPSALHDAHPLWRTQKIWTVIDIRVVSQHANAADVTTAQRGVPLQAFAGTGADDDPSSRRRPFRSPSRSHVQPPPLPVPRSATALRKRPRTDVRSAWSSASSESGLNRPAFSFDQCSVLAYTWSPRTGHAATNGALPAGAASLPRLGRSGNQERFCSSRALASRRSLRMTAVRATFGGFPWPRSWRYFARRSGLQRAAARAGM